MWEWPEFKVIQVIWYTEYRNGKDILVIWYTKYRSGKNTILYKWYDTLNIGLDRVQYCICDIIHGMQEWQGRSIVLVIWYTEYRSGTDTISYKWYDTLKIGVGRIQYYRSDIIDYDRLNWILNTSIGRVWYYNDTLNRGVERIQY